MPPSMCPTCGNVMDHASGLNEDVTPVQGDISLCIGCGEILTFNENMILRKATIDDVADVDDATMLSIRRAQEAIHALRGQK